MADEARPQPAHLPEPDGAADSADAAEGVRGERGNAPGGKLPGVGILRAVSGEQLRLYQPADGAGGDLLLLPPRGGQTHAGAVRRAGPASVVPGLRDNRLPRDAVGRQRDGRGREPVGAVGKRDAGDVQHGRLRLPQAERVDAAGAAEPGVADSGFGGRVRLAGSLRGARSRRILCTRPPGGVAGGAPHGERQRHGDGHRAGLHFRAAERAALQRQRQIPGDVGALRL
ncbi:hypothetical protein NB703_004728 [Pantoea ananatis]|uniref:Uncharacterized protein n=1 Tax=Pantoea ananas TaxID=553 RepID=A0AAJ1FUN9_PANAN|nr:hypothetical protein [Pantoea ananatis]